MQQWWRQQRQMKDKPKPQSQSKQQAVFSRLRQRTARQKANGTRHSGSSKVNKFHIVEERVTWQHFVSRRELPFQIGFVRLCRSTFFSVSFSCFFSFLIVLRSSTTWRPCVSNMIICICMCACVHTCCDFQCCHIQYFFASYLFFSLLLCCWFLSPTLRAVRIKLLCMIWIIIELENHSHSNMSVPVAQAHLEPHTYSCVLIYAILVATTCYAFLLRKLFSNCTPSFCHATHIDLICSFLPLFLFACVHTLAAQSAYCQRNCHSQLNCINQFDCVQLKNKDSPFKFVKCSLIC